MIEMLRSGAAATLPLLPSLLRAGVNCGGGGSDGSTRRPRFLPPGSAAKTAGAAGVQDAADGAAAAAPASPSYSCSDSDSALAAAAAAAEGLAESPLVHAKRLADEFGLNEEQREVLAHVAGWASGRGGPPPVCLIHGPFGSGEVALGNALRGWLSWRGSEGCLEARLGAWPLCGALTRDLS
jgi:hypothetical protein